MPSYLAGRGIGARAQQHWLTGYARAGPGALVHHLRAAGYPDALILAAGLARRSHRGYLTDTFRDRAVLPICSPHGTRVGFIGRAAEQAGPAVPKYLNSPTTGLYDKSQALFGLWQAHDSLAAGAVPVIAEGPLDAIAIAIASDAGGRSRGGAAGTGRVQYAPVALCGSALTVRQVETLARTCDLSATGVLVALDNDEAGRRAAVRAFWMLSPHASRVEAVDLSPASDSGGQVIGHDPAQILRDHGLAALSESLRTAGTRSPTLSSTPQSGDGHACSALPKVRSAGSAPSPPSWPRCAARSRTPSRQDRRPARTGLRHGDDGRDRRAGSADPGGRSGPPLGHQRASPLSWQRG